MLCLHFLTVCRLLWAGEGMKGRLVQLDFSAAFDKVSHCGLLYRLWSTGVGGQFLSIISKIHSDRRQRVFGWEGQCVT